MSGSIRKERYIELEDLNPLHPDHIECPHHYYAKLQDEAPVWRAPEGFYMITRHKDIMEVLRTPEVYSSDYRPLFNQRPEVAVILKKGVPNVSTLATLDPPDHARYRALVNKAFSQARVNALVGGIERRTHELIDAFVEDCEVELVQQFAMPLTMSVTAEQLGVPQTDLHKYKEWSDARVVQFSLVVSAEEECEAARKRLEFQKCLSRIFEEKRERPTDDMISVLATTRFDDLDRGLTVAEFLSIAEQLMTAGNVTTTHAFGSSMLLLLQTPGLMQALAADPAKFPGFIEEALRLESPASGIWRIARADTELGGVKIPRGSSLHLRLAAGNRDRRQFDCPMELDLGRKNAKTHLAFGYGHHVCIGSLLARKELDIGLRALLARLPNIRLAEGKNDLRHTRSFTTRGLEQLYLTFERA